MTLAVRDLPTGRAAAADIAGTSGRSAPEVRFLELSDLATIAGFAAAWTGPLHLLVANAGVVTGGLERTARGFELQLAVNHLGHFALATGLHARLRQDARERGEARIVAVGSTAHISHGVDLRFPHFAVQLSPGPRC